MATNTGPRVEVVGEVYPVIPGSGSGKSVPAVVGRPTTGGNATADGGGTIFVSIASYRDGERCGQTLKALFENAKNPDKIVVGLVEQNSYDDQFCISEYCKFFGVETIKKEFIRDGMKKVVAIPKNRGQCPHYAQIRLVAFHDINAKGPMLARSMIRKVLGNEEFCMQIDAHTDFVKHWDELVRYEWDTVNNEFAIISNVPAPLAHKDSYGPSGPSFRKVPRQCEILFRDNGLPDYQSPADGFAIDLEKPLLSHTWSAAFSFSKCHLEESAPYDPFLLFAMPIEQFSRYARFWTRGYDVYTPTRNIVFHDYGVQPNGHGNNEWFKRQRDRFRKSAFSRVKTFLQMSGGDPGDNEQANLGIYGLGKRRSLQQLQEFVNVDLTNKIGNTNQFMKCVGHKFIPYDAGVSPTENLFSKPDRLDPQPEYPLRTQLKYYQQVEDRAVPGLSLPFEGVDHGNPQRRDAAADAPGSGGESGHIVPGGNTLFILWIFGLMVWCTMFVLPNRSSGSGGRSGTPGGSISSMLRKKKQSPYKDV